MSHAEATMAAPLCLSRAHFICTVSAMWPLPVEAGGSHRATPDLATPGLRTTPSANCGATPCAGPHCMVAIGAIITSSQHGAAVPVEQRTRGLRWEWAPAGCWDGAQQAPWWGARQPMQHPSEGRNLSCAEGKSDLATWHHPSPAMQATQRRPSPAESSPAQPGHTGLGQPATSSKARSQESFPGFVSF